MLFEVEGEPPVLSSPIPTSPVPSSLPPPPPRKLCRRCSAPSAPPALIPSVPEPAAPHSTAPQRRGEPCGAAPALTQPFVLPPAQGAARGRRGQRAQAAQTGGGCGAVCRGGGEMRAPGGPTRVRARTAVSVGSGRPHVGVTARCARGCVRGGWGARRSPVCSVQVGEQSRAEPPPLGSDLHAPPYRVGNEEDAGGAAGESVDGHAQGEWGAVRGRWRPSLPEPLG